MGHVERFWGSANKEEITFIATSVQDRMTMRAVNPVYFDGAILIFTDPSALKYQKLKDNPHIRTYPLNRFSTASRSSKIL